MGESIAQAGVVLKTLMGFVVFGFLIWSTFFQGSYELGLFSGIGAVVAILIFSGFAAMVPFGTTFAPIIFEWWWHDVPFWEFSTAAWVITCASLVANGLLLLGAFGDADR